MSSIVVSGDTSGAITISAPAVSGTNTLTLPANTGTFITTASSGQIIPKAALPTGSILQVVTGSSTAGDSTTSTSFVATSLSASITPLYSTSKIYIIASSICANTNNANGYYTLYRGATNLGGGAQNCLQQYFSQSSYSFTPLNISIVDSPATTSATTYQVYMASASGTTYFGSGNIKGTITLMEVAA